MRALFRVRPPGRWAQSGLCDDLDLFFSDDKVEQDAACALCAVCPVQSQCLRAALADVLEGLAGADEFGIRAGFRPDELRTGLRGLVREGLIGELLDAGTRLPDVVDLLEPLVPERTVYRWAKGAA